MVKLQRIQYVPTNYGSLISLTSYYYSDMRVITYQFSVCNCDVSQYFTLIPLSIFLD